MLGLIWTAIIGLVAGMLAKAIYPGKENMGWLVTMLLGVGGSFAMSFLGKGFGWYKDGESAGFIMSVLGAVLILFIYNRVVKK